MISKENGFALPGNFNFRINFQYAFAYISIFIILIIIYSNSFYGEWHFDDFANIVNNPYIQIKDFSWENVKHCIYGLEQKNPSRPLSYLSYAWNYYFSGTDVFAYHLVNFIIHYLAALFLFLFIYNTLKLPLIRERYSGIAYPTALLAALFWAINPVHVTSVTYIVQRMASMAGLFYIMSMFFYLKARTATNSRNSIFFFIFSAVFGLAAILSKENAVMLPVSIFIYDLFLITGLNKENIKKYLKFAALPILFIAIAGFIYADFSAIFEDYKIRDFTMVQRLLTEPRVILFYLSLLFYPINSRLTLLYDIDVSRSLFQPWTTLPAILLILTAICCAFYIAKKRPLISFCIIFYFLNHLIEGSIFSLELIYEHRNYLPSMLLFIPVAEFIIYAIDYFSYKKIIQIIVALGIVVILVGEGDNSYNRNKIVSDDLFLWLDNINKSPRLSRPHSNLGRVYANSHMNKKALFEYQKAIALNNFGSKYALAIQEHNSGLLYFGERKDDQAMYCFEKSLEILPRYIQTTIHIAKIKMRHNKIQDAKQIIEDKLKKYPGSFELMELYSFILLKYGEINESKDIAKKCLIHDSNSIFSLQIMAEICRQKNNYSGAISYLKSLRLLMPRNAFINLELIELYAKINNPQMLNQEIQLLLCLKGSLKVTEYIKILSRDKMLLVYVPDPEDISFILKNRIGELI
jgi:tetratricopeptide (TPR) repeat protein